MTAANISPQANERQKLYEQLRHLVSSNYKVPDTLTLGDLEYFIAVISGNIWKDAK